MQKQKSTFAQKVFSAALTLGLFFTFSAAFAQEDVVEPIEEQVTEDVTQDEIAPEEATEETTEVLETAGPAIPSVNQKVSTQPLPEEAEFYTADPLSTLGLKFMIRGKEALAWSLNIDETGFDNPAIEDSYSKVLVIVNSLFTLGLLILAGMWMFSLVIPRETLKRVVFYYVAAVLFVNFAFPINRLFIDSTNLLQRTFLVQDGQSIEIADIVETPSYEALESTAYRNSENDVQAERTNAISARVASAEDETAELGTISPSDPFTLIDGFASGDGASQRLSLQVENQPQTLTLSSNSIPLEVSSTDSFSPNQESSIFAFSLMGLTGIAYFTLALIFVARIVLLWGLMILSPILFLLAVFQFTRGYFYNWLGMYAKWLLIGPLAAIGIAAVVNIWKTVGIPITSTYAGAGSFGAFSTIGFTLPGSATLNTLSTTGEMMEYLIFLLMLYVPLFFAFALTKHKHLSNIASTVVVRTQEARGRLQQTVRERTETREKETTRETQESKLLGGRIEKFAETVLPERLRSSSPTTSSPLESAHSLLPEQLAVSSTDAILDGTMSMMNINPDSRHANEAVIEALATPQVATSPSERRKLDAVRTEIEKRAASGDAAATLIQNEISNYQQTQTSSSTTSNTSTVETADPAPVGVTANVNVERSSDVEAPVTYQTNIQEAPTPQDEEPKREQLSNVPEDEQSEQEDEVAQEDAEETEENTEESDTVTPEEDEK